MASSAKREKPIRQFTEHYSYHYTKKVLPGIHDHHDDDDDDTIVRKFKKFDLNNNPTTGTNKNNGDDDEYNPYRYGFRPLSEKNIYRSFEVITPDSINSTGSVVSDSSAGGHDEVDAPPPKQNAETKIQQATTMAGKKTKTSIGEDEKRKKIESHTVECTIPVVNERAIDVPGEERYSTARITPAFSRSSGSSAYGRLFPESETPMASEKPRKQNTGTASGKPPLHPSSKQQQTTTHFRRASDTEYQRHRPMAASPNGDRDIRHHEWRRHHYRPSLPPLPSYRIPESYEYLDLDDHHFRCRKCLEIEPIPTEFHSYKCTKYTLEQAQKHFVLE